MPTFLSALARLAGARPPAAPPEAKRSAAAPLIALQYQRQPVWSPRDYGSFAREGFAQNPVVYRCVRMIAESAAAVPLDLFEGGMEHEDHPLLDLLRAPNPTQTAPDLLESWYGFLLVAGNSYMEAVGTGADIRELYVLRPDRMTIVPGADGWPLSYDYTVSGQTVSYSGEAAPGVRKILHLGLFHPSNDYYGLSPIEAAATAIDIHNAASAWNKGMLDNSALPSGALVYNASGGQLTSDQYERLKAELEAGFQGARNAGRPMLLEGGLDWRAMSMTPKDMDFIESKRQAARDIALALGVPPMLLGIPGDNTHANYAEAHRSFWRHTVLPLVGRSAKALSGWLGPAYGGGLELRPDLDAIVALAPERDDLWKRIGGASFLTDAEKRAAVGYADEADEAEDAGEAEGKFNPGQPRVPGGQQGGGQWAGQGGATLVPATLGGPQQYQVYLPEEEVDGGHTIRDHVLGPNLDNDLVQRVIDGSWETIYTKSGPYNEGAFYSRESANDFINRVLEANSTTVDLVANGALSEKAVNKRFNTVTGREAHTNGEVDPFIRPTFSVRVVIRHDTHSPRGYRVFTAFPINLNPDGSEATQ